MKIGDYIYDADGDRYGWVIAINQENKRLDYVTESGEVYWARFDNCDPAVSPQMKALVERQRAALDQIQNYPNCEYNIKNIARKALEEG